jgi:hypothetical protein
MSPREPPIAGADPPTVESEAASGQAAHVRLEVSRHGSLVTPRVLAVVYEIIDAFDAASRAAMEPGRQAI